LKLRDLALHRNRHRLTLLDIPLVLADCERRIPAASKLAFVRVNSRVSYVLRRVLSLVMPAVEQKGEPGTREVIHYGQETATLQD
jgi:hypothetical protein